MSYELVRYYAEYGRRERWGVSALVLSISGHVVVVLCSIFSVRLAVAVVGQP